MCSERSSYYEYNMYIAMIMKYQFQLNLIALCSAECKTGGRLLPRLTHLQVSLLHWPSTSWARNHPLEEQRWEFDKGGYCIFPHLPADSVCTQPHVQHGVSGSHSSQWFAQEPRSLGTECSENTANWYVCTHSIVIELKPLLISLCFCRISIIIVNCPAINIF